MPRVVKEEDYAARRNEILDVARKLVYTRGYEQMSIQNILDALKISKGAFYHYFDSKQSLLDGLIERMLDDAEQVLRPIVDAKDLSAIEKMRRYFDTAGRWKVAQKKFMLDLFRVWRADANAIMRQKQEVASIKRIAPMLTEIIRQGIDEGVFSTKYPEQFGNIFVGLSHGFEDKFVELLLTDHPPPDAVQQLEALIGAYSDSVERILGAPSGSLPLGNIATMKEWLPK
ncbi:MAG: TetR/AcrR family transcriptional regulator [Anaerolineales bacterium]|jgi:AcrR family transcriptional regulator|uniref:TetR/AcrR family transcriptional regulator n=1 Tax=Candidatus Villigracilis affinis TaxID=3140682 RepID=UPI001D816C76|nr:TetR/AcrR family transcriptional regulator [Anaerolineales bacterium]MBK9602847.1 TetR/AcrR family transcriptional regulator [Anaerolineales bacterium]MBL0346017.1 TetR/AcrR family transcriptional regulator [Anaerolineales bacterium]